MKRPAPLVDLVRKRQLKTHLAEVKRLMAGNPALAARTQQMLSGELPCPDLEEPMKKTDKPVAVKVGVKPVMARLPGELVGRATALLPRLAGTPAMAAAGRPTTTAVIRVALSLGLAELERQHPASGSEQP